MVSYKVAPINRASTLYANQYFCNLALDILWVIMPIEPPRPKSPPLNALRAFEAAARHGAFTLAAEELCVTPGAVAQQIKNLEDWVGAPLFDRKAQGVALTALGAETVRDLTQAFDQIGAASQKLRLGGRPAEVRIAALPAIAQLWLSPRLPAIRETSPDIAISVFALEAPPNMRREHFDLGIFYRPAEGASALVDLGPDEIFPVSAPGVSQNAPKLFDAAWADDWTRWSGAPTPAIGPVFSLYSLAVAEAAAGAGVLIGHGHLVADHLARGDLIATDDRRVQLDRALTISLAQKNAPAAQKVAEMLEAS